MRLILSLIFFVARLNMCPSQKSLYWGWENPTFSKNPYNGVYKPLNMWKWEKCHHSTGNWLLASNKRQVIVPTLSLHERKWLSNLRKFFASKDWSSKNWPLRPSDSMESHDSHPMRNNFWPWKMSIFLSGFQGELKHSQLEEIIHHFTSNVFNESKFIIKMKIHILKTTLTTSITQKKQRRIPRLAGFPPCPNPPVPQRHAPNPKTPVVCKHQHSEPGCFFFKIWGWKYLPSTERSHIPPTGKAGKSSTQTYLWEGICIRSQGIQLSSYPRNFWHAYFGMPTSHSLTLCHLPSGFFLRNPPGSFRASRDFRFGKYQFTNPGGDP